MLGRKFDVLRDTIHNTRKGAVLCWVVLCCVGLSELSCVALSCFKLLYVVLGCVVLCWAE